MNGYNKLKGFLTEKGIKNKDLAEDNKKRIREGLSYILYINHLSSL